MIGVPKWKEEFDNEISQGILAREKGNEGMARVCARRAVGILINEYFYNHGFEYQSTSAFDQLSRFTSLPEVDEQVKTICNHFLLKVDSNHNLPVGIDLLVEAQWLAHHYFPDSI
jgi:hypothetical protein